MINAAKSKVEINANKNSSFTFHYHRPFAMVEGSPKDNDIALTLGKSYHAYVKVSGIGNDGKTDIHGKGVIKLLDPDAKAAGPSLFHEVSYYGNWVISVLGFLYWAYQITRSAHLYWTHDKETGAFDILVLHFLLFIANILYLIYEVNVNWTPVYFTMLLLTDITGVWCYLLITQNRMGH